MLWTFEERERTAVLLVITSVEILAQLPAPYSFTPLNNNSSSCLVHLGIFFIFEKNFVFDLKKSSKFNGHLINSSISSIHNVHIMRQAYNEQFITKFEYQKKLLIDLYIFFIHTNNAYKFIFIHSFTSYYWLPCRKFVSNNTLSPVLSSDINRERERKRDSRNNNDGNKRKNYRLHY